MPYPLEGVVFLTFSLCLDFDLRQIKSGHTFAQRAEQIGAGGVCDLGNVGNELRRAAIRAVDRSDIAYAGGGDSGYVGGGQVHRNCADDRRKLSANNHAAFVGKRADQAVSVACREDSDTGWFLSGPAGVISDTSANGKIANGNYSCPKRKYRPHVKFRF